MSGKKLGRIIIELIPYLFFLIAFLLILTVVISLKNKQTPTLLGYGAAVVVSPSMEDTIMTGDLIFYHEVDPGSLVVGDIITFWQPLAENPVTITHRIIAITETGSGRLFTTQGDNNSSSLDWEVGFSEDAVIGKYVNKSTFMGKVYVWFVSAGVGAIYIVVIIVFLLIALMEVKNIFRELTKAKMEKIEAERAKLVAAEVERLHAEQDSLKPKE